MEDPSAKVGPPAAHIEESEVDGRISLFDPQSQEVSLLNDTASDVWRLCDGTSTLDQVIELMAKAYGVKPDAIGDEVRATVETFYGKGLLAGGDAG
ncbi:MAG: PqqD family protein [Actinobacteria bacterium]|nr:PqqD family protein [Actinomycetota bacterium]